MRVAMFYSAMDDTNAHGKMDRRIMAHLADDHEITVFSTSFDNPDPSRIDFVRVPAPSRPLLLQFLVFHLTAALRYLGERLRGRSFDVVHFHDVDLLFGDVCYCQFSNTAYVAAGDAGRVRSLRQLVRSTDHRLRAAIEPFVLGRTKRIVVPSKGLADELTQLWGRELGDRITVIPNFIRVESYRPPVDDQGSEEVRQSLGIPADALLCIFVALGHFERKGLGELIEAMGLVDDRDLHLLLVGGSPFALAPYLERAEALGIDERVHTVGTSSDIRPYLWASDVFTFPTRYETFSLVAYEAAAAELPLVATPVHGIVDIIEDGVNGWLVQHDRDSIAAALERCLTHRNDLRRMGRAAAARVADFGPEQFDEAWTAFYTEPTAGERSLTR